MVFSNALKPFISFALTASMLFAVVPSSLAGPAFRMHSGHDPNSPSARWMELLYAEVFKRLAIPHEILYLPNKRGALMTESGEIDGQVNRVFAYQTMFPHQLRVNEPISRLGIEAWVRSDSGLVIDSWQSFKGSDLRVDYVRGVVAAEINLTPLVAPEQLTTSSFAIDGLTRLKLDQSDVFVHSNFGVYHFLLHTDFAGLIHSAGIITSEYMYPYVHVSHAALIPEIERVIREIKAEGLLLDFCFESYGAQSLEFCHELQPD